MTGRNDWHELQGCGGEIEEASFDGGMEIASLYGAYANDTRRRRERERVSERYTYSLYETGELRLSSSSVLRQSGLELYVIINKATWLYLQSVRP